MSLQLPNLKKPVYSSVIFSLALFISLSLLSFISARCSRPLFWAKLSWSLAVSYFGFCIYHRHRIYRYRSALFILIAFFFFLEFKLFRFLSLSAGSPPYCHIAQSSMLLNFAHSQFLALKSGDWLVWGPLTLGFLWLLIMFTIGQGICSWVCFYGGIDEAFSKIRRSPLLKMNVSKKWRDFPLALLIFLLIVSFLQGLPVFCKWLCPFKMTSSFWDADQAVRNIQLIFFLLTLAVFLVLLPILTRKRTFCSLICPFGALASVCGRLSPYRVTIDKEKCTLCKKCLKTCPVFAITNEDLDKYQISSYCNRCGKCIDICPAGAIDISIRNSAVRNIFIFISLLITGAVSGLFVPQAILKIIKIIVLKC